MSKVTKVRGDRLRGSSSNNKGNKTGRARKQPKPQADDFSLPTEVNVPPEELSASRIMIFGRKGIGKTSLAAQFPRAVTFMFEMGRRNLPIAQVPKPQERALDWPRFRSYVQSFLASDHYDTAVIDTLDRCYLECFSWCCSERGCEHPNELEDESYQLWDEISMEFERVINVLHESDKGLIFISHDKQREIKLPDLSVLERVEPTVRPQGFKIVQTIADFVLYYHYMDGGRVITLRDPNGFIACSCGRDDHFLDREDGSPIRTFKISGEGATAAYEDLIRAYDNELEDMSLAEERRKTQVKNRVREKRERAKKKSTKRRSRSDR